MKRLKPLFFLALFAGSWALSTSYAPRPQYAYLPFYMTRAELEHSVFFADGPREMSDPGKIWVRGTEIFVNERYKGVHVIDNSDPRNPRQTGFIVAPGCIDMAVKGDIIYMDNAVDLVAFNLDSGEETSREKDIFPPPSSPDGMSAHSFTQQGYILVGWSKAENQ